MRSHRTRRTTRSKNIDASAEEMHARWLAGEAKSQLEIGLLERRDEPR
jgi:hypothetical protein